MKKNIETWFLLLQSNNNNTNNNNAVQFFVISVLAQEPEGQLQRQYRNVRKMHK